MIGVDTTGTDYTIKMRYWECREKRYYAGQEGGPSRHLTRMEQDSAVARSKTWDEKNVGAANSETEQAL